MLVELAACLPRSARERLDVWFVVTSRCGHLVNAVGSRLGDGRPTYVLALSDPGCGMPIVAGVGDAAELAADAATSLQLPFRRRWTGAKLLRPFARMAMPGVLIGGDGRDAPDPARLRAVEHLVAEFSLRWARRATQTGETPPAS
ncbi:MAG: hypothetical protein U0794_06115 [Isosphaeraceae bacterium]